MWASVGFCRLCESGHNGRARLLLTDVCKLYELWPLKQALTAIERKVAKSRLAVLYQCNGPVRAVLLARS